MYVCMISVPSRTGCDRDSTSYNLEHLPKHGNQPSTDRRPGIGTGGSNDGPWALGIACLAALCTLTNLSVYVMCVWVRDYLQTLTVSRARSGL